MAVLMPEGKQSFQDAAGAPLAGGKVYTYAAGTSTPKATYSDAAGTIPNANPVVLNSRGEATIFWDGAYKVVLTDAAGVTIWTQDNIATDDPSAPANALRADLADASDAAHGDAMIAVKQPFAGAVARTQHTKNAERMTLLDFIPEAEHANIAAGTSTYDCTTAFLAAINAVGSASAYGATLRVPAGSYRLTATLTIPSYISIEGEGRWSTRLMFEGAIGVCVDIAGANTDDKRRSVLRRLRVDGTKCTGASAVGVRCDWNQSQSPLLDEVTIYGGYEAQGVGTGLSTGLGFVANGNNWIVDFEKVAVEGCRVTSLSIDASPAGYANIINFFGCRFENCKGRNVSIKGPGDSTSTMLVNFFGATIEGASYQTTGVNEDVLVDGAGVNFSNCWFESHASPNWPVFEVNTLGNAWVNFHSCNWAWSQYAVNVRGRMTFSGVNTIRSATGAIIIADGGRLTLAGDVAFLDSGVPLQSNDATGVLDWARDTHSPKTSTGTIPTSDFGATVSNAGAKAVITLTLPNGIAGATLRIVNAALSLRNAGFEWRLSGSGSGEYYLVAAGGGNPNIAEPTKLYSYGVERSKVAVGSLTAPSWGYGNNDSLGFNTIYYRDGGGDPDGFTADTIMASYAVTVAPSNNQRIVPLGTSGSDSIVSDGVPGSSIKLRCIDKSFWLIEDRVGTWS